VILELRNKIKPIKTLNCLGEPLELFCQDIEVYIDEKKCPHRLAKIILDGLHVQMGKYCEEIEKEMRELGVWRL
jgi:hypothetical protein